MKLKRFTALLLAAALMFILTSCATITVSIPASYIPAFRTAGAPAQTPAGTPAASEPAQTPAASEPAAPSDPSAPAASEPAAEAPADTGSSTGAPSSKAEVIKYYCDAYNKINGEAKSCTRTYDYTSNYNSILNINGNSTLESLANTLMDKFMVENTEPQVGGAADLPPVGLTTLNIPEDKVSEATCTDNGDTYEIVVKSTGTDDNYELDVNPGEGSTGLIGPLLRTDDVTGAAGSLLSFEGLHAKYATASVKATVEKSTGHIVKMEYLTPCILHFDQVKVTFIKVQNCDIGLLFQQTWTVEY